MLDRNLWALRLGSPNRQLLARTLRATRGMAHARPHAAELSTLNAAHMRRLSHKGHFPRAQCPLAVVHMDVLKIAKKDLPSDSDGNAIGLQWALVCVDDFSRFVRVYFARTKEEIPDLIRLFFEDMGARSLFASHLVWHSAGHIHTDGGKELNSRRVSEILSEFGFAANVTSSPDTPASNGLAEAIIRVLCAGMRARLSIAGLPGRHWHHAFLHAATSHNLVANVATKLADGTTSWRTPHELFFGRCPDLSHQVIFGAPCRVIHLGPTLAQDGKTSERTDRGRVLNYGGNGVQIDGTIRLILGYQVLLDSGRIVYSRNVYIDERSLLGGGHSPFQLEETTLDNDTLGNDADSDITEEEPGGDADQAPEDDSSPVSDRETDARQPVNLGFEKRVTRSHARSRQRAVSFADPLCSDTVLVQPDRRRGASIAPAHLPRRRPAPVAAAHLTDGPSPATPGDSGPTFLGEPVDIPGTLAEARASPLADQWLAACRSHIEGLKRIHTYEVQSVPINARTIPSKWVFDVKTDAENQVLRFKARLVIQGFRMVPGRDFTEVFSPTIRHEQVRLLLAIAAKRLGRLPMDAGKAIIAHYLMKGDVKDAYYTALLAEAEQILFGLPPGFEGDEVPKPGHKLAARAIRAMPGMRQAGRVWHHKLKDVLNSLGFEATASAPCIFIKEVKGGIIIIGHFVDDLIMVNLGSDTGALKAVQEALLTHFMVNFSDTLDKFLGAQFDTLEEGIHMHLHQYIGNMVTRYGRAGDKLAPTPERVLPSAEEDQLDVSLLQRADVATYQSLVGALNFCVTTCRPDIGHAVNMLARRLNCPRVRDLDDAHRVLRYLQGTRHHGILFRFATDSTHPGLLAYSDSDYANDVLRRLSTTGYLVFYNGSPVSWYSGLQKIVAQSSTEAEYIALSDCSKEVVYLRQLLQGLRDPTATATTMIYVDNKGAIDLVNNPVHHKRTKHIDVRYHFIRSQQEAGTVSVHKVHTDLNKADPFTKALTRPKYVPFRDALMYHQS